MIPHWSKKKLIRLLSKHMAGRISKIKFLVGYKFFLTFIKKIAFTKCEWLFCLNMWFITVLIFFIESIKNHLNPSHDFAFCVILSSPLPVNFFIHGHQRHFIETTHDAKSWNWIGPTQTIPIILKILNMKKLTVCLMAWHKVNFTHGF